MSMQMNNISLKSGLDQKQLSLLQYEFNRRKRNKTIMLVLWFFLGLFGAHRFYAKDYLNGFAMLFFGWITLFIWNIVDVFFVGKRLEETNDKIELEIIKAIHHE